MNNAKNRLLELCQGRGWSLDWPEVLQHEATGPSGGWRTRIDHTLPDGRRLVGEGIGNRKSEADDAAIAQALAQLAPEPSEEEVMSDAQRGDALLKLAAHVVLDQLSTEARSIWQQEHESDAYLAAVFDQLWEANDPDVRAYGPGRGEKFKASLVEALLWRRFQDRVLRPEARTALREILDLVAPTDA